MSADTSSESPKLGSNSNLTKSCDEPPQEKTKLQNTVTKNLGKTASGIQCRFSCGGSLPQVKSVAIRYKRKSEGFSEFGLPTDVSDDKKLQEFLDTCSTASFGMGSQAVTDKSYRDALKLDPESFSSSFILASITILHSVATVMTCGSPVRAELYKLNVYCPGGFFKAHVDTPRSSEMIGSLVVGLPSQFAGGALVTRHQGREVVFDWSSSSTTTQWAAFYSDVEHEVLPVTSGHRFTLTYNLYHTSSPCQPASFDIAVNPLYKELLAALQTPHFMREGGTLGFFCQYRYVESECEDPDESNGYLFLKGEDMVIYQVAKSLGLNVQLKPVTTVRSDDGDYGKGYERGDYIMPTFNFHTFDPTSDSIELDTLETAYGNVELIDTKEISWCIWSDERKVPLCSFGAFFGNDPTSVAQYQSAALLVKVPKFSTSRGMVSQQAE